MNWFKRNFSVISITFFPIVSGSLENGQLLSIMGPSGSGKTTLLNAIMSRNMTGLQVQEGKVFVNNCEVKDRAEDLKNLIGYVEQNDEDLNGSMTVLEHLNFLSGMRQMDDKRRNEYLLDLLGDFSLRGCQDTILGSSGGMKGLSGGEKRRLAVVCCLLRHPRIMLIDEPTTGLDTFMAERMMKKLR